ncbi:MAG: hypothetical protein HY531_00615, partial [Chloroflexi bacterium]|nr:hypothetical protein [Chloroflexota bacterium]
MASGNWMEEQEDGMYGLRSELRNWHRLGVILVMLGVTVAVACGPAAATPTPTSAPPTPTRAAAAPTATPTTAPAPSVATPTPTRPPGAPVVVATPTPTAAAVGPGVRAQEGVKRGGVLRVAGDTKVSVFDLHQSTTNNNALSQGHMYDQLLRMNPSDGNKTIIPDLASSWEMSQDGLSYTYHLRPGVKFHDGSTMTADDVVATYNKIIFPGTGVLSPRKDMFAAVTKVEAVDPLTVRFVLKRPSAGAFTGTGTAWNVIVSKKTLEANKNNLKTVPDYPGTGPFRLVRFTVGEQIVSERNPDYWNKGLPYLDGVTTLEAGGGSAGAAAVFTGKAEYAGISYDLVPQAERSNG